MRRRALLKTTGLTVIGLQFGLLAGCSDEAVDPLAIAPSDPGAPAALRALAARLEGIDFVGPVCVDELGEAEPLDTLLARLRQTSGASLEDALSSALEEDFATGDRLDIAGWQLARTECLLLAAAATAQGLREPARAERSDLRFEDFAAIEGWGPDETIEGEIFNPIGNGRGGFWIRVADTVPGSTRLVLDGVELATHFEPGVVTASLDPDHMERVVATPGMVPLLMVDTARNIAQRVGYLTVRPRPPAATLADGSRSEVFCEVERWGPDHAPQGQAFNEQPDGSAAFWVRIGCAPAGAVLVLDGTPLETSVRTGLVSARVPHYAELAAGDHRLQLRDPASGEILDIGTFRVL
jgi:hypothetical protein